MGNYKNISNKIMSTQFNNRTSDTYSSEGQFNLSRQLVNRAMQPFWVMGRGCKTPRRLPVYPRGKSRLSLFPVNSKYLSLGGNAASSPSIASMHEKNPAIIVSYSVIVFLGFLKYISIHLLHCRQCHSKPSGLQSTVLIVWTVQRR